MSEREPAAPEAHIPGGASANHRAYWRANLKLTAALMSIWFIVSFGFGILLVDPLNQIPFFGFKLGFWWAQQGSIFVFVILIFVYTACMKRLDRKYDVHEEPAEPPAGGGE